MASLHHFPFRLFFFLAAVSPISVAFSQINRPNGRSPSPHRPTAANRLGSPLEGSTYSLPSGDLRGESGPGSRRKAPWVGGEEDRGLYFSLIHESRLPDPASERRGKDSRRAVRRLRPHTLEYHNVRRGRDAARWQHRRGLAGISSVESAVGGRAIGNPGAYYVNISLGSQPQSFHVLVDTGSDPLWVPCQCQHCAKTSSYLPLSPPYSPSNSTSSSFLGCSSSTCAKLQRASSTYGCPPNYAPGGGFCQYSVSYADGGFTQGEIVNDSFNLLYQDGYVRNAPLYFGCAKDQGGNLLDGSFGFDGLLGLAQGPLSAITQLSSAGFIKNNFAMCLQGGAGGGHLTLGATWMPPEMQFAPLVGPSETIFYYLSVTSVQVASATYDTSALMEVNVTNGNGGLIVDSGTAYTLLPQALYAFLLDAVFAASGLPPLQLEASSYDCVDNAPRSDDKLGQYFPNITLNVNGASWVLQPQNYLFRLKLVQSESGHDLGGVVCFAAMSAAAVGGPNIIIGDSWLRNFYTVYDVENGSFGWLPMNCTSGEFEHHISNTAPHKDPRGKFSRPTSPTQRGSWAPAPAPHPGELEPSAQFDLLVPLTFPEATTFGLLAALNLQLTTGEAEVVLDDMPTRSDGNASVLFHLAPSLRYSAIPPQEMRRIAAAFQTLLEDETRLRLPYSLGLPQNFKVLNFRTPLVANSVQTGPGAELLDFTISHPLATVRGGSMDLLSQLAASLSIFPYEGIQLAYSAPSQASTSVKVTVRVPQGCQLSSARTRQLADAAENATFSGNNLGLNSAQFGYLISAKVLLKAPKFAAPSPAPAPPFHLTGPILSTLAPRTFVEPAPPPLSLGTVQVTASKAAGNLRLGTAVLWTCQVALFAVLTGWPGY